MTPATFAHIFAAIATAEQNALDAHEAGVCSDSEWSCSHCESPSPDGEIAWAAQVDAAVSR